MLARIKYLFYGLFILLAQSCSYGDDYVIREEYEYIHAIAPQDAQQQITFLEYPEAGKKIFYDTAGAKRLLISAYANTLVNIGTKTDTFHLLIKPNTSIIEAPGGVLYKGYRVIEENFNSHYKTSIYSKNKYQFSSYQLYQLDTLYFK